MKADDPWLRLIWSWQAFNGAFQRNVLNPLMEQISHAYSGTKERAQQQGTGGFTATMKGVGAASISSSWFIAAYAALLGGTLLATMARQYLLANDEWEKHRKDGTLTDWLREQTISRSGTNGMLDPLVQAETAIKYSADVSKVLEGGPVAFATANAANILHAIFDDDPTGTNTRMNNAMKSVYNLTAAPAISAGMVALGAMGGPLATPIASVAAQYLTRTEAAQHFADIVTGPKGAQLPKDTEGTLGGVPGLQGLGSADVPGLPGLGTPQRGTEGGQAGGSSALASAPVGILDDFVQPLWRVLRPAVTALPGWAKVVGAAGLAAEAGLSVWNAGAPFRGQPPPEKKP
jgi:hypothetical protein